MVISLLDFLGNQLWVKLHLGLLWESPGKDEEMCCGLWTASEGRDDYGNDNLPWQTTITQRAGNKPWQWTCVLQPQLWKWPISHVLYVFDCQRRMRITYVKTPYKMCPYSDWPGKFSSLQLSLSTFLLSQDTKFLTKNMDLKILKSLT